MIPTPRAFTFNVHEACMDMKATAVQIACMYQVTFVCVCSEVDVDSKSFSTTSSDQRIASLSHAKPAFFAAEFFGD